MILELPNRVLKRSTTVHNSRLEPFCDWLEANVLFEQTELAFSDVVDRLIEEQIYADQDFAWEFVGNAMSVLRSRASSLQRAYPFEILPRRIQPEESSAQIGPYRFCLSLSVLPLFPNALTALGSDFTEQGLLLERLAEAALGRIFPSWGIHRTGWSVESPEQLPVLAERVANIVDASVGRPEIFSGGSAKEAGLDVLCYRPFPDARGGYPCMFVQCTTGASTWKSKRKEPDLAVWQRAVLFDAPPMKAFVIPFAISAEEMRESSIIVEGPVIDRVRLLLPGRDGANWLPSELESDLNSWIESRHVLIPRLE